MSTGTADQWNRGVFLSVRTFMHLIGAISFWYGVYYDFLFVNFPNAVGGYVQFGGKFKFLTFLDATSLTTQSCAHSYFSHQAFNFSLFLTRSIMSIGTANKWNRGIFLSVRTLMHLIGAISFWYGNYYFSSFVHFPQDTGYVKFGGKFKFLTFLDAIIQASYFTLCVLNDVIGTNEVVPKKSSSIRQLKDYVFGAFAWPLALNVGVSFWTLMAIDRELVLPKVLDPFFPTWLNHVMHTNIVIFIVMELFTTFRQYPSRKSALTGLSIFMLGYLVWIHIIKYVAGVWVYPVLNVLEFGQRIVFFIVILLFCLSLYFIGEFLNNKIWAAELRQIKSTAGKRK